jgi:hypothetical protein
MTTIKGKRKIRQNIYGNYKGYIGVRQMHDFGTDEIAAGHWMVTGELDFNAAYAPENYEAAKEAARKA